MGSGASKPRSTNIRQNTVFTQSGPGTNSITNGIMKGTRRAGRAAWNATAAAGRGLRNGVRYVGKRMENAPGSFFGRGQNGRNVFGRGASNTTRKSSNNNGKPNNITKRNTRTWKNFFGFGKKKVPASIQKAANASANAIESGTPADANKAINALAAAQSTVEENSEAASAVAAAAEKKKLGELLQNMANTTRRLNRGVRI
jgi:hypothetical protein